MKGIGDQIDYGMRVYDPRAGRFLSVDPLFGKFPFYSSYQYAGNTPLKFIDLDGGEPKEDVSRFWSGQPLINISQAPAKGYNAAGVPRNSIWFFKEQLAAKPEMFSESNKLLIMSGSNPIVNEQWVQYNPTHKAYMGQKLWHHHIDGGEMVAAIPKGLNNDYFSELHPYVNAGSNIKGTKVSGLLGGTLNVLGNVGMFTGLFTGDPDSWINSFGFGDPHIGEIKKDYKSGLYVEIMSIADHYIPVLDANGTPIIDPQSKKPEYRLGSKTIQANIYSGYIWNEDTKKFEGVNRVDSKTEEWKYDDKGKRIESKPMGSGIPLPKIS